MVGPDESNCLPPVATKVSTPFTDNCMALGLLRKSEGLAEVVDDVGGGFDADRQPHQFLTDACGLKLCSIHLLMRGAGRMNNQRLGIADIGQMTDQAQAFDELPARRAAALDSEADDRSRAAWQ